MSRSEHLDRIARLRALIETTLALWEAATAVPRALDGRSDVILRDVALEGLSNGELNALELELHVLLESEMAALDDARCGESRVA